MVVLGMVSALLVMQNVKIACEFKCHIPNRTRVPNAPYSQPKYYVTQGLSQMNVKNCKDFLSLSWIPESSQL